MTVDSLTYPPGRRLVQDGDTGGRSVELGRPWWIRGFRVPWPSRGLGIPWWDRLRGHGPSPRPGLYGWSPTTHKKNSSGKVEAGSVWPSGGAGTWGRSGDAGTAKHFQGAGTGVCSGLESVVASGLDSVAWGSRERRYWFPRGRRAWGSLGRRRARFPCGWQAGESCERRFFRAADEGSTWDDSGIFGAGQAIWAVSAVCEGSQRGVSLGDAARSSWSGMTRLGNLPYFLNL